MKILHLSSAKTWRGGEQQIAWLYLELKKLGIQQAIACPVDSELEAWCRRHDVPLLAYNKRFALNPIVGLTIKRYCRREKIDLIHIHDAHAHTFAVLAASLWGNPVPLILSRRVDFPIKSHFFSHWKYNHPKICYVLCVSDFIRRMLAEDLARTERLQVVYDGVDTGRFGFVQEGHLLRELDLPPETVLIGNVAAVAPHKDYFTFVDTAALVIKQRPDVHFVIIGGDGGEESRIREYIHQKNLNQHISMLGFRNDVPQILPELNLFLFTSKTEGLGSSILDAFACQVPVVATRAGGITEIVVDGETGLLAPVQQPQKLTQQVLRLLDDKELAQRLSANAFSNMEQYSGQQMAKNTLYFYRKALEIKT